MKRRRMPPAIVRATCPKCGDIEMTINEVQILVCMDNGKSTYNFVCPSCKQLVNKEANEAVVESLASAGARMTLWTMPKELCELQERKTINHDDLLEFHILISGSTDSFYAALRESEG